MTTNGIIPIGCIDKRIIKQLKTNQALTPELFKTFPSLVDPFSIEEEPNIPAKLISNNGIELEVLFISNNNLNKEYGIFTKKYINKGEADKHQEYEYYLENGVLKRSYNKYFINNEKMLYEILDYKKTNNASDILKNECFKIISTYSGSLSNTYFEIDIRESNDKLSLSYKHGSLVDKEKVLNDAHDDMVKWMKDFKYEENNYNLSNYIIEVSKRSLIKAYNNYIKNANYKKLLAYMNEKYNLPVCRFNEKTHKYGNWSCNIKNTEANIYYEVFENDIESFNRSTTIKDMLTNGFKLDVDRSFVNKYKLTIPFEIEG